MTTSNTINDFQSFSLKFDFAGPEDKPYFRALYSSSLETEGTTAKKPNWGYGTIQRSVFNNSLAIIIYQGFVISQKKQIDNQHAQYFLEITMDEKQRFCNLGFNAGTYALIDTIKNLLPVKQQLPMTHLLSRFMVTA